MEEMDEATTRLLVLTALPISDIATLPGFVEGRTIVLIWVDLQDRPDLLHMGQRHRGKSGEFVVIWFFIEADKQHRLVGMRVDLKVPFTATFSLVFPLRLCLHQLEDIADGGLICVTPGPPPARKRAMSKEEILATAGDGISLDLEEPQRQQLREQLFAWK